MKDLTLKEITELPHIAYINKQELPKVKAIYFILDSESTLVYIGQTKNLRDRFNLHHRVKDFIDMPICSIHFLELKETDNAKHLEKRCIAFYEPYLNNKGLKGKRASKKYPINLNVEKELYDLIKEKAGYSHKGKT